MGLISALVTLPIAPLRGTIWLADQIATEAERRFNDPAAIRQVLEEIAAAREAGTIRSEVADRLERDLVLWSMRGMADVLIG